MKYCLLIVLSFTGNLTFGQNSTLFVSDDNTYRIFLPNDWAKKTEVSAGVQFSITAPQQSDKQFASTLQLETGTLQNGFQNADIEDISKKDLELTKKQAGEKLEIIRDSFVVINNKKWWNGIFHIQVTKKSSLNYFILKTVHNQITYTLSFSAPSDFFLSNLSQMYDNYMRTIMFYKSDITAYKNISSVSKVLNKQLKSFEGIYFQQHPGASTKIIIGDVGDGKYGAKEVREITRDGKTFVFEAMLKPENISGNEIILNSDEVVKADLPVIWGKGTYQLNQVDNSLQGTFSSKSNDFKGYAVALENQKIIYPKADGNGSLTNQQKQKTLPKIKLAKTYGGDGDLDESNNIKLYGDGLVSRNGKNLSIKVANGNKRITLTDNESEGLHFKFLGQIEELDSYVVERSDEESGTREDYVFVNKRSGFKTDDIPSLEYSFSPSKKLVVFITNGNMIEYSGCESSILIYAITNEKIAKIYEKITFDDSKHTGWEAKSVNWLNDDIIEVSKQVKASLTKLKDGGKCWLTQQNGIWAISNVLPKQNSRITIETISTNQGSDDGKTSNTLSTPKTNNLSVKVSSVFTGNISKRWQVAGCLTQKFEMSSPLKELLEFEFLPGKKFIVYKDGAIKGSGEYILATDKKSILMSASGTQIPAKIYMLTNETMVFKADLGFTATDLFLLYPINTTKAKEALLNRKSYYK